MQSRPCAHANRARRLFAATSSLVLLACAPWTNGTPDEARPTTRERRPEISVADLERRIAALTAPETEGRATGQPGEARAAAILAGAFADAGLAPAGDDGDWLHAFEFTAGVSLGANNAFEFDGRAAELDRAWRPLAFSRSGTFEAAPIVFAGYGLVAPETGDRPAIDDYKGLEVRDRWVMVLRDLPAALDVEGRRALRRHAALRYKAMVARDRGARGILFVSGPRGRFREPLAPLRFDASLAGTSVAAVSISDELAETILASAQGPNDLETLHAETDAALIEGVRAPAIIFEDRPLSVRIDLETRRARGTNVLGRLQVGAAPSDQTIVIGAHFDHLGRGEGEGSLADADQAGAIHPGADDNASGTALVVELAEWLAARLRNGDDLGRHDFLFALWSGEELGLLGSDAWVNAQVNPHGTQKGPIAYLNFDMVGRLREHVIIQGVGSSDAWPGLLDEVTASRPLSVLRQSDSYVPTDATTFYKNGVPILSAFTGVHDDYHKPSDTLDKLDLDGIVRIGELFADIAVSLGRRDAPPTYLAQQAPSPGGARGGFRVFLGTIPDYARTDVVGVLLSGVQPDGPAERAGLRRGDLIVAADGRTIENLYDYTYALEAMRVGEPTTLRVRRGGEAFDLEIVPASRD